MLKAALLSIALTSISVFAFDIPKKLFGEYVAEIESFKFEHDDSNLKASSHIIRIILKPDMVWYQSGKMTLKGNYQEVKSEGQNVLFDIHVSNEKSINLDFNLDINKKTGYTILSGLKGVPETRMFKKPNKPEKNRGFSRL
jgi:hypothetical protein